MSNPKPVSKQWYRRNWIKVVVGLVLIVLLFRYPPTRDLILFILPLGFKADDIIVDVALVVILGIFVRKGLDNFRKLVRWFNN